MSNKKTFVIQIDGIEKAYNDLALLGEALDRVDEKITQPKTANLIASAFKDVTTVVKGFGQNVEKLIEATNAIQAIVTSANTAQKQDAKADKKDGKEEKKEEEKPAPILVDTSDVLEKNKALSDSYKEQLLNEENFRKLLETPYALGMQIDALDALQGKMNEINAQVAIYGDNAKYTEESGKVFENYYKLLEVLYANDADKLKATTDAKDAYNKEYAENTKKIQAAVAKNDLAVGDATTADKGHELLKEIKHLKDLRDDSNRANLIVQKAHIKKEEKLHTERNARITALEAAAMQKRLNDKKDKQVTDVNASKANFDAIKALRQQNIEEIKAESVRVAQIYDEMAANFEKGSAGEIAIQEEKKNKLYAINEEIIANEAAVKNAYKTFHEAYKKELDEFSTTMTVTIDERNTRIAELEKVAIEKNYRGFMGLNSLKTKETQANLDAIKALRQQNIKDAKAEAVNIAKAYDEMAAACEKGSKEEIMIQDAKQKALHKINTQIIADEQAVADDRKAYNDAYQKHFDDLAGKISATFEKYNAMYTQVGSFFKGVLDMNIQQREEDLAKTNKQLEEKTKAYTAHKTRVESLEKESATASGGRAIVLQEQISREMVARDEALQQQKEQEKTKEELEKKIARKKKQQAKIDKVQEIAKATADQSAAIIKAWGAGPVLGPIMAGITAAATTIQLMKLIKSWDKLEDGGLLRGKRHSQGGMRIEGTNIEVEGDEFVVNRVSTSKNLGLIDYINRNRKQLTPHDIDSYFMQSGKATTTLPALAAQQMFEGGGQLTNLDIINSANVPNNDKILEAIGQIDFKPVVSVVDIANVQQNIANVKDIAGL